MPIPFFPHLVALLGQVLHIPQKPFLECSKDGRVCVLWDLKHPVSAFLYIALIFLLPSTFLLLSLHSQLLATNVKSWATLLNIALPVIGSDMHVQCTMPILDDMD